MNTPTVKILSSQINAAVVHLPDRKFPGSVIQGDSLKILSSLADEVFSKVKDSTDKELVGAVKELRNQLHGRLKIYEEVLSANGISLPY